MNQQQNFGFNSQDQNKFSNRTIFTATIFFLLLIAVVSIFSARSYASVTKNSINASLVPLNLLTQKNNDVIQNNLSEFMADTTGLRKGNQKLNFFEDENGNRVHYRAKLSKGKLTELYIDGENIPSDELVKYENKIQTKLDEYESTLKEYRKEKEEYKKFAKEYAGKIKEHQAKLREFRDDRFDFNFEFDRDFNIHISKPDLSELRKSMRELRRELRDSFADRSILIPPIHIPQIHVPPVPPLHFDEEQWDKLNEEMNENMDELKEELKNNKFNIREFNESMKEFRTKMKEFGFEMKKFGKFIKEMKNELINDKIINPDDDIDELLLSEDKMEVNGKTLSADLHKKYKDLYEKHTGKKIEGKNKIRIND